MGVNNQLTSEGGALDLVITNVTVLDAVLGVVKADVGIKDGLIAGIGKAGNSGTMDGVTPGLDVGPATDAISGEQLILTAGASTPTSNPSRRSMPNALAMSSGRSMDKKMPR